MASSMAADTSSGHADPADRPDQAHDHAEGHRPALGAQAPPDELPAVAGAGGRGDLGNRMAPVSPGHDPRSPGSGYRPVPALRNPITGSSPISRAAAGARRRHCSTPGAWSAAMTWMHTWSAPRVVVGPHPGGHRVARRPRPRWRRPGRRCPVGEVVVGRTRTGAGCWCSWAGSGRWTCGRGPARGPTPGSVSSTTACSTHSSGPAPSVGPGHRGVLDRHEVGEGAAGALGGQLQHLGAQGGQQPLGRRAVRLGRQEQRRRPWRRGRRACGARGLA